MAPQDTGIAAISESARCRNFDHRPDREPHLPEWIPREGVIAEEVIASKEAAEWWAPASPEH